MPGGKTDRQAAHPGHKQEHPTAQLRDRDAEAPTKTRARGETDGSKLQEDRIQITPIERDAGELRRRQSMGLGGGRREGGRGGKEPGQLSLSWRQGPGWGTSPLIIRPSTTLPVVLQLPQGTDPT